MQSPSGFVSTSSPVVDPVAEKTRHRISWVDYAKGIGIFLVVVGHTLRGLIENMLLEPSPLVRGVDQWIYAFHMPLFFFLSGLFIERSLNKSTLRGFVFNKIQVIVYPYLVWSILQEVVKTLSDRNLAELSNLWRITYQPPMQFWFLYVLFIISVAYAVLRKSRLSVWGFLAICGLFYLTDLLKLNLGSWGVAYMVRLYILYFGFGVLVSYANLLSVLETAKPAVLRAIALAGFSLIGLLASFNLLEDSPPIPVLALIGIVASVAIAKLLEQFKHAKFIQTWGILSLQIYVAHTIASAGLRIILEKAFKIYDPTLHVALGIAVGIYAPIALYIICEKLNFPYLFTLRSNRRSIQEITSRPAT